VQAAAVFRVAVRQPQAPPHLWGYLLLAEAGAGQAEECRKTLTRIADLVRAGKDPNRGRWLLAVAQFVPCDPRTAARLAEWSREDAEKLPSATTLHRLGAWLYRAGQYREADRVLAQAARNARAAGLLENELFQAMTARRLGRPEEARDLLARFEEAHAKRRPTAWMDRVRWNLLLEETRALVNNPNWMPSAEQ
jgi:hypothetical protein